MQPRQTSEIAGATIDVFMVVELQSSCNQMQRDCEKNLTSVRDTGSEEQHAHQQ